MCRKILSAWTEWLKSNGENRMVGETTIMGWINFGRRILKFQIDWESPSKKFVTIEDCFEFLWPFKFLNLILLHLSFHETFLQISFYPILAWKCRRISERNDSPETIANHCVMMRLYSFDLVKDGFSSHCIVRVAQFAFKKSVI